VKIAHLLPLVFCLMMPGPRLPAQADSKVYQFQVRLLDIGIEASPRYGVRLLAAPSISSKQGADSTVFVWIGLHPDSLVEWLNHAAAVLHTPAIVQAGERIQWSRELRAPRDSGHLALGRTVKQGKLQKAYWLAIADKKYGWSVEISSREADSLLALLFVAGTQSRLTDSVGAPFPSDSVELPVRIRSQPNRLRVGVYGRVFARYVVDTAGQVEPGSLVIVLASDPMLAELAREVLRRSRFYPALSRSRPVRQLVEQAMIWHPEK
jgi:hypothetical protein